MACRIGMSKYPRLRIDHWRKKCNGRFRGKILASDLTYDQAQRREEQEAIICGPHCKQEPGGPRSKGKVYSVYRVDCN